MLSPVSFYFAFSEISGCFTQGALASTIGLSPSLIVSSPSSASAISSGSLKVVGVKLISGQIFFMCSVRSFLGPPAFSHSLEIPPPGQSACPWWHLPHVFMFPL